MNDQTIRCQRQLRILHENGYSDADIAYYIKRAINDMMDSEYQLWVPSKPASQTVYRWRTGKSNPSSMLMMMLVSRLFREAKTEAKKLTGSTAQES